MDPGNMKFEALNPKSEARNRLMAQISKFSTHFWLYESWSNRRKSETKGNVVLVNHALLKNRVDSASNKIKDIRDPETILKRVQDKVQGDKSGLFTRPSYMDFNFRHFISL